MNKIEENQSGKKYFLTFIHQVFTAWGEKKIGNLRLNTDEASLCFSLLTDNYNSLRGKKGRKNKLNWLIITIHKKLEFKIDQVSELASKVYPLKGGVVEAELPPSCLFFFHFLKDFGTRDRTMLPNIWALIWPLFGRGLCFFWESETWCSIAASLWTFIVRKKAVKRNQEKQEKYWWVIWRGDRRWALRFQFKELGGESLKFSKSQIIEIFAFEHSQNLIYFFFRQYCSMSIFQHQCFLTVKKLTYEYKYYNQTYCNIGQG